MVNSMLLVVDTRIVMIEIIRIILNETIEVLINTLLDNEYHVELYHRYKVIPLAALAESYLTPELTRTAFGLS